MGLLDIKKLQKMMPVSLTLCVPTLASGQIAGGLAVCAVGVCL